MDACFAVHRELGPGLNERVYGRCVGDVLVDTRIDFVPQAPMPVTFRGRRIDMGYKADFLVEGRVILEVKAVKEVHDIHIAQLINYLRLSGIRLGFLANFNVEYLPDGWHRRVV